MCWASLACPRRAGTPPSTIGVEPRRGQNAMIASTLPAARASRAMSTGSLAKATSQLAAVSTTCASAMPLRSTRLRYVQVRRAAVQHGGGGLEWL